MNRKNGDDNSASLPILDTGIGRRIGEAAALIGTRDEASAKTGIARSSLMRYIREGGVPIPLEAVVRISRAAGVSLDWIVSGVGSMHGGPLGTAQQEPSSAEASEKGEQPQDHPTKRYDRDLLMEVAIALEEFFEEEGMQPTPERRAKLTALLYEISIIREHIARDEMKSLLKVAA